MRTCAPVATPAARLPPSLPPLVAISSLSNLTCAEHAMPCLTAAAVVATVVNGCPPARCINRAVQCTVRAFVFDFRPRPPLSDCLMPCLAYSVCLSACLPACLSLPVPVPVVLLCRASRRASGHTEQKPCATLRLPQEITICHPQPPLLPPHGKTSLRQFASKPPQDTRHDATVEYSTRPAHLLSTMSCPLCPALPCPPLLHCPYSRRHALITHRTRWR